MKNKIKNIIFDVLFWIIGCSIYSAAIVMLIEPNQISPGGFTGISTVAAVVTGIPTGTILLLLNIPLLIMQYKKFGGSFVIRTAAATFILSCCLNIASVVLSPYKLDGVLAAVFGGLLAGLGLSLVLLRGATTGGADVIAMLINHRYRHLSVGKIIMVFDLGVILLTAFVYRNIESALYSIIAIYAASRIIDGILYGADRGKIIFSVTDKWEEISERVIKDLGRGVTVIDVMGGYTKGKKQLMVCALRINEAALFRRIVYEVDKKAFVIISDAGEIIGEGFKKIQS